MSELKINSPFTLADAQATGLSSDDMRSLRRRGDVREVVRGIYVSADVPDTLDLRAAALTRVVPPRAVACRRTAAWLHGVDVLALGSHVEVPPVELLVPAGTAAIRRVGVIGYSGVLCDDEVVEINGVLATSPVRTTLDLGRLLPLVDGVAAVDAMLHAQLVTIADLMDVLPRFRGYRHKLRLDRALDLADGRAESPQESRLRIRLVVYAKLPRPEVQYVVPFARGEFRLDLAYVEAKVAVEYDGTEHHSEPADVEYDRWRRDLIGRLGWKFHVARSHDVLSGWMDFTAKVASSLYSSGYRPAA